MYNTEYTRIDPGKKMYLPQTRPPGGGGEKGYLTLQGGCQGRGAGHRLLIRVLMDACNKREEKKKAG